MKFNLFWSTYAPGESLEEFRSKRLMLSPAHTLSILSHHENGSEAVIYTYQDFKGKVLPSGIEYADANDLFPVEEAFSSLERGHSIAHVSDIVRMTASINNLGVILDMDVVILKPLPNLDSFYSTMPAKRTGGVAIQWGKAHPPIKIHDESWDGKAMCGFPLKVASHTSSQFLDLVNKIKDSLSKPPRKSSKGWNYVLWTVKDIIKTDLTGKVFQPMANIPVATWMGAGKCYSLESPSRLDGVTKVFGHLMPTKESIMKESYMVSHFFESAFSKSNSVEDSFWHNVPEGCLLADEALFICGGENWSDILTELTNRINN
tara:strand:- start:2805 stop:3758 length:954 start_codon:yes stop_codon:yes gene_type:complete